MTEESVFTAEQRALLKAALNRIVPAENDFPGAGDLDVAEAIERSVAVNLRLRRVFLDGLVQIDLTAWREADRAFVDLPPERQDRVLKLVEQAQPAFFDKLVSHTYRVYYVNSTIVQLLGLEARSPQPTGYTLPPFDPAQLENVRTRGSIYRKV